MSTTQFNSTSFFLSKWAQEKEVPTAGKSRIELDIVEDPNSREVCVGNNCSLYFDKENEEYITMGRCQRVSLCTESRIIKDRLFLKEGNISSTVNCLNYEKQLLNWA